MTGDAGNPPGFGYPFVRTQNLVTTPKTPRHHRTRIIRRSRAVLPFIINNLRRKDNSSPTPFLLHSDIADIVWHERRHLRDSSVRVNRWYLGRWLHQLPLPSRTEPHLVIPSIIMLFHFFATYILCRLCSWDAERSQQEIRRRRVRLI